MKREHLADLSAFATVAHELSFTRAASKLGMTQSSLSHAIRRLEGRLGLRLLSRTTRSVAPTDAGERLLRTLRPAFEHIDAEIESLTALREKPAGSIRITTAEHAAETVLLPALERLLPAYPDIHVEVTLDYGLTDVVAERFDAGIRLGEQVAKDMVAVRIGPDFRMAAVATPGYFANRRLPKVPQELHDHQCINVRLPTAGGIYAWEFERAGREVDVRVEGQLTFNNLWSASSGGEGRAGHRVCARRYRPVGHRRWAICPYPHGLVFAVSGYRLYPSRRQTVSAFAIFVEALRYRRPASSANRSRGR